VPAAPFDIAIIGGGINGCGIARDAAGRGLSVYLCERGDLASATSSASTKLIHGGLRYLEYYHFRLVREALLERETLLKIAPHIIRPLRFVLPRHKGLRPAWLIRLGLFCYDHLGGREELPATATLDLSTDAAGEPLKPEFRRAFEYSDCAVDDARLVVLNAVDAAAHGAVIETCTELMSADRGRGAWRLRLRDVQSGATREIAARVLVNAAGPWVAEVAADLLGLPLDVPVRLVKGSHIVVPKTFSHERAYIFQNADRRIVFAIPYEADFTLIGTTDVDYIGDPSRPTASVEEVDYLCAAANRYFRSPLAASDVVWSYAGVRPLYDDGASAAQAATRDYVLKIDGGGEVPPVLNIFGGKITTYRRLAEAALDKLAPYLGKLGGPWTGSAALPGGDFAVDGFAAEVERLRAVCSLCRPRHAQRLVRAYGTRALEIVDGVRNAADWGRNFGADLTEREVGYLMGREWARTAADILWRRSKLGLKVSDAEARALDEWMGGRTPTTAQRPARSAAS
jgi:glycerol-3-phosphate dehydrogenase